MIDIQRVVEMVRLSKTDEGMLDLLQRANEYYILKTPADKKPGSYENMIAGIQARAAAKKAGLKF